MYWETTLSVGILDARLLVEATLCEFPPECWFPSSAMALFKIPHWFPGIDP